MSAFAIRNPYLIIVLCLIVVVVGVVSVTQMPVDLFPEINIPVVVVATFYSGMPPEQIEADITSRFERFFTLASSIDHIESRSLPGVSLIKIYFQPGSNADTAVTTISNLAMANLRRLPPGTLPPIVLKFDASSLPVCLITLQGDNLGEGVLRDTARYAVRNQVAGVAGASVPQPFGGKYRQVMVYVDPLSLEAHQLSPMDIVRAVNDSNLILPAGDVRMGPLNYNIYTNSQVETIDELNRIPIKVADTHVVTVGDVGKAEDAQQIQYNVVRVDGQPSVYLPVLKQGGDTNTIAVVDGVRNAIANLTDVPAGLTTKVVFDQSEFVRKAINTLIHEGLLGLIFISLMILVFLGSFRATVAVFLSIPLSALAAFIFLWLNGGTINTMVLSGLALVFSRVMDNSVISLENIYRHLENGVSQRLAAEQGGQEVALPVLSATLTTSVVFFPVIFLEGVSRFLFTALGLAVALSLFASYIVALTVVPLYSARYLTAHGHGGSGKLSWGGRFNAWFNRNFNRMLDAYGRLLDLSLKAPVMTVLGMMAIFAASLLLYPKLGLAFFPRTDAGQFVINLKGPSGTRLEVMEREVERVERLIREEVGEDDLDLIISNIGLTPGFSSIYTSNSAQHTATVQVGLKEGHAVGSFDHMDRVRQRLAVETPHLSAFFQSGGLVDAVLNLGLPAPINVQVSGSDLKQMYEVALNIADRVQALPEVSDVYIPADLDYPSLQLTVDRVRAAQVGLSQKEVIQNVITALTSNQMIAPSYWVDHKSGVDYMLTVQYPEGQVKNMSDLRGIPLHSAQQLASTRLGAISETRHFEAPTQVDHYQLRRVIDVYVSLKGEDLGRAAGMIDKIVANVETPEGVRVDLRGMVEGMRSSFRSFGFGLILAILLVYLILVAQFESFIDPFLILLSIPMGLTGVLVTLYLTNTTLNVQSLMGVVMLTGIVGSNSILIVELIRRLRQDGLPVREAITQACRIRLRPVIMTSLATVFGLMPLALNLGTGSESYAPLARAIIGGLSVSLITTVFLVPAAYLILYRRQEPAVSPREA